MNNPAFRLELRGRLDPRFWGKTDGRGWNTENGVYRLQSKTISITIQLFRSASVNCFTERTSYSEHVYSIQSSNECLIVHTRKYSGPDPPLLLLPLVLVLR